MADIRAQLSRVREAANDVAATATDRIKDSTEKAREGAGDLIQSSRDKASEAYGEARSRTQKVATRANEIVQEHPIVAVAGAVAAGAVIAWMFPKSRAAMKSWIAPASNPSARSLSGLASAASARVVEAALAARSVAADGADTIKQGANHAIHAASDAATAARKTVVATDLPAKASHLTDDVVALVSAKVDAIAEAIKARLPKN